MSSIHTFPPKRMNMNSKRISYDIKFAFFEYNIKIYVCLKLGLIVVKTFLLSSNHLNLNNLSNYC